jgi:hypothetical protein
MACDSCPQPHVCESIGCFFDPIYVSALDKQVSGNHYKDKGIQPIVYIHANNLGFCEGNVIKYVTRHKSKAGKDDILKAIHYLELLLELEYGQTNEQVLHKVQK